MHLLGCTNIPSNHIWFVLNTQILNWTLLLEHVITGYNRLGCPPAFDPYFYLFFCKKIPKYSILYIFYTLSLLRPLALISFVYYDTHQTHAHAVLWFNTRRTFPSTSQNVPTVCITQIQVCISIHQSHTDYLRAFSKRFAVYPCYSM